MTCLCVWYSQTILCPYLFRVVKQHQTSDDFHFTCQQCHHPILMLCTMTSGPAPLDLKNWSCFPRLKWPQIFRCCRREAFNVSTTCSDFLCWYSLYIDLRMVFSAGNTARNPTPYIKGLAESMGWLAWHSLSFCLVSCELLPESVLHIYDSIVYLYWCVSND